MAERFERLGKEVVTAFESNDPHKRMNRLRESGTEILVEMLLIIGWLERRREAHASELMKSRMHHALHEAVQCAGLEIPEYVGGKVSRNTGPPSIGAQRTATLVAFCLPFACLLRQWAEDIEHENVMRRMHESAMPPHPRKVVETQIDLEKKNLETAIRTKRAEGLTERKIVAFLTTPPGKDLCAMVDAELKKCPSKRGKGNLKRTRSDVVRAALKPTYSAKQ